MEQGHTRVILVGVDGSPGSMHALRWAAKEAELGSAELWVLTAWLSPVGYGYAPEPDSDLARLFEEKGRDAVMSVLGRSPKVPVRVEARKGESAPVLIEASRYADLLVVGSKGHGGFVAMLLGSVTNHCIQHAACPVVVVREPSH